MTACIVERTVIHSSDVVKPVVSVLANSVTEAIHI
jgi:hypothetical protein